VGAARRALPIAALVVVVNPYEARRVRKRQRSQQHRVDEGEDRGIGADADGEHKDSDCRKPGLAPEGTERITKILPERVEPREPTRVAMQILDGCRHAEIQARALSNLGDGPYFIDRRPERRDRENESNALLTIVAPGTFAALGIPLKQGRDFSDGDAADRPLVAIVNDALVRRSLPARIQSAGRFSAVSIGQTTG
jgi:hypothetical protein